MCLAQLFRTDIHGDGSRHRDGGDREKERGRRDHGERDRERSREREGGRGVRREGEGSGGKEESRQRSAGDDRR
jgi:hypothetical protein